HGHSIAAEQGEKIDQERAEQQCRPQTPPHDPIGDIPTVTPCGPAVQAECKHTEEPDAKKLKSADPVCDDAEGRTQVMIARIPQRTIWQKFTLLHVPEQRGRLIVYPR